MVYNKYIGIIGGTGTIGSIIVKYLLQLQTHFHVLIGGRRSIKEISMSTFYNSERLKYNQMNYNNDVELDNFCSQCLLVINAVGPSFKINDKIALHALRNNCHYIDIGGYGILRDLLKPYEKSIEAQKLCFIIGVGWMPGISGVFSKTIIETHLNSPENTNFNIYYGAVDNWSYSSTYDLAASSMGKTRSYVYSHGKEIQVSPFRYTHHKFFPFIGHKKICIPRKRIINWLLNRPRHSEFTILICPRCQDPQQVIRRHDSNHNTLDRNVISGNIVPNLNLSGRNVRNYFPRMAPVVDQSTSLGPDPIRPHWIRNAPLRNRRVVQLFQNLARNRIGQDDRRTKYRVELFRSIRRSGHPEALIRTYRRNLIQRKVITGKFILIEQSVELRFRGRRETYVTVGRFDLSTRYRGRTAALPAMGSNAVHRTLHDLQRTRIGTRLFHRRNRQLTRRIPRGRKNLLFERRATPQQDCKQQKVRFLHRHNVFADKLQ